MKSPTAGRVLQFCHGYDGPFLDCARQYAALFDGTGYQVTTVFLTGIKDPQVAEKCQSAEVIFMEYSSSAIRGLKIKAIREFRQIARARDFSFCIAHRSKPTYIACLATDLPVIGVHHAFGDFDRLGRRLFARAFRNRLHLLGVSDAVRDDIRNCLPDWPQERIQTLYNRIDVEAVRNAQVDRAEARRTLGLAEDAWVVGNVGRLHPDKDQTTLLKGFALALPDLPEKSLLVIIGKGRLEASLKRLAGTLRVADKVLFLGQVPDARNTFKAFDVFALTSDHEPFGMVLLEAMAAGVPIICSDCGGGPEVVGAAGELYPLGSAEQLASRLQLISQCDVGQIESYREAGHDKLVNRFSDAAALTRFWSMPFIKETLRGKT
ncbi:glycosyltransferase [Pseudomonas sp. NyZ704]|nr:glycosyltransferase [Pseudomonas sp. NyZ704]